MDYISDEDYNAASTGMRGVYDEMISKGLAVRGKRKPIQRQAPAQPAPKPKKSRLIDYFRKNTDIGEILSNRTKGY